MTWPELGSRATSNSFFLDMAVGQWAPGTLVNIPNNKILVVGMVTCPFFAWLRLAQKMGNIPNARVCNPMNSQWANPLPYSGCTPFQRLTPPWFAVFFFSILKRKNILQPSSCIQSMSWLPMWPLGSQLSGQANHIDLDPPIMVVLPFSYLWLLCLRVLDNHNDRVSMLYETSDGVYWSIMSVVHDSLFIWWFIKPLINQLIS